jgi:hypothetical protein
MSTLFQETVDVLNEIVRALPVSQDHKNALHERIDTFPVEGNVPVPEPPPNPWVDKTDSEVVTAAIGGDAQARDEYARRQAESTATKPTTTTKKTA